MPSTLKKVLVVKDGKLFTAHLSRDNKWVDFKSARTRNPGCGQIHKGKPDALRVEVLVAPGVYLEKYNYKEVDAKETIFLEDYPCPVVTKATLRGVLSLDGTEYVIDVDSPGKYQQVWVDTPEAQAHFERVFKRQSEKEPKQLSPEQEREEWKKKEEKQQVIAEKFQRTAFDRLTPQQRKWLLRFIRNQRAEKEALAALAQLEGWKEWMAVNFYATPKTLAALVPTDILEKALYR